jgi:DNA-binding transcriptional MerR regulator
MAEKADGAFLTIGEVSDRFGVPTHVLRYWETRFTQLRPLTRAGNRRYYRPDDVALVERINTLLNTQGYTVKGVQLLLAGKGADVAPAPVVTLSASTASLPADFLPQLKAIRHRLVAALG